MAVTYKEITAVKSKSPNVWLISVEKKTVGHIVYDAEGYQYFPKGQTEGGDNFPTLHECMKSLAE